MQTRLTRSEVLHEQTWSLDELFASTAQWDTELEALEAFASTLTVFQGQLGSSAATLLKCLDAREALQQRLIRVSTFAHLRNAQDGTNPEHQAAQARVTGALAKVLAHTAFVDSEIVRLPDGTVERFLAEEPALRVHQWNLQDLLDLQPHVLSPETEKVLASLGEVMGAPSMVYNRSKSSDIQFAPFQDATGAQHANSFSLYEGTYESHCVTGIRRAAWQSFGQGLKAYNNTYAATFATEVRKNVVMARQRGYRRTEDMLLQPHKISFDLYTHILDIIQRELAPHMRRYARLRQRLLGLDRLGYCDIKAPIDPEFNPSITYEEACDLIQEALAVMGPEYAELMHTALTQRWVDRCDNIGKSTGAFCASPYGVHPYILVTWSNSMRNAFTLAHELGHAGHFSLAQRHQRLVNTRPAMPFVEAPSTLNEMLLAQHILAQSKDAPMRRWVIMQTLGTYHHNFVTHLLEAELQRQVYAVAEADEAITAASLNRCKGDILTKFWGDTVHIDDTACMTWMRQPHYYMGLYPYTYAVGLVTATAMAQRVRDEGAPAVNRWLTVLKAGGTLKPLQLMSAAGIDMASPQPIHDVVAHVGALVDELEQGFSNKVTTRDQA